MKVSTEYRCDYIERKFLGFFFAIKYLLLHVAKQSQSSIKWLQLRNEIRIMQKIDLD